MSLNGVGLLIKTCEIALKHSRNQRKHECNKNKLQVKSLNTLHGIYEKWNEKGVPYGMKYYSIIIVPVRSRSS